jgi:hypothetical protein
MEPVGVGYRARNPTIKRMVALKTITTGLAEDPDLLQGFYREAQSKRVRRTVASRRVVSALPATKGFPPCAWG